MSSVPVKQEHSDKQWASWLIIIAALVSVIALAVYNSAAGKQDPATVASADAVTIDVSVDGMAFTPSSVDIPAGSHLAVSYTHLRAHET